MTTRRVPLAAVALIAACGAGVRPFPPRAPMWRDPDMTPFAPPPAKYKSPEIWNTVDNTIFRPLVEVLAVERAGRARNVNSFDEVPDSSWFTNRIDQIAGDPAAIAQGACTDSPPDPDGPWTVYSGKPDGANPGFFVEHASGKKYLFKPDVGPSGERQSTAEVLGSRVYHAAGYHAPCSRVAFIDPATFVLSPGATAENFVGDKVPFTRKMLDDAFARRQTRADGRVRGGLSELLEGKPIGPWRDFGVRPDDPNDVIPHQDRRELRGSYIFAAWLAHYDAREQNSLDTWITTEGDAGYVRHWMMDFGDCLGSTSAWARVTGRRGHAYEMDWPVAFVELVTFGLLPRPWRNPTPSRSGPTLGFFTPEVFTPDRFRTAYPYGPFTRLTEADAAWGARILARLTPAAITAIIDEAHLSNPEVRAELERTVLGRREKLLERFLAELSPLTRPRVEGDRVCVADARVDAGLAPADSTLEHLHISGPAAPALAVTAGAGPGERCVGPLPALAGADVLVLELRTAKGGAARVHVYADGGERKIAGLER